MRNKCVVESCNSRRKNVNLFKFPKAETGLKKWLEFINCDRLLSLQEYQKFYVCKKHFEKRFFTPSSHKRSRLRVGAYPTLFTDSEITSGVPRATTFFHNPRYCVLNDHDYLKRPHVDHSYAKNEPVKKMRRTEELYVVPSTSALNILPSNSMSVDQSLKNLIDKDTSACEPLKNPIRSAGPKCLTRKRIATNKKNLSSCCIKLYREYVKSKKQLKFQRRAKRALKFSEEKYFEKLTKKINPLAKKNLWMQIKQCTKQAKGRRFTNEEKLIALSIMKQSPKCYKFLHKIFILPSKRTLNKMVAQLNIDAGVNPQILEAVKHEVASWDEKKKYCSILFDEVALEAALTYDKHKDCITGFVELSERTNYFADHALVFMLRGAIFKWQQPLAFYFCKGATSGEQLKTIIKEIINAVCSTGLLPIALVSDQGTAFQSALKGLQEETRLKQINAEDKIGEVCL